LKSSNGASPGRREETTLLAGLSGFYMVHRLDLWSSFSSLAYWWLDAMALVWLLFTLMLFVAEPLFLDRWLQNRARVAPDMGILAASRFVLVRRNDCRRLSEVIKKAKHDQNRERNANHHDSVAQSAGSRLDGSGTARPMSRAASIQATLRLRDF
jgi:hypothetical protein